MDVCRHLYCLCLVYYELYSGLSHTKKLYMSTGQVTIYLFHRSRFINLHLFSPYVLISVQRVYIIMVFHIVYVEQTYKIKKLNS